MESDAGLMKRALLGFAKIPPKSGATFVASLRHHLSDFIHLRLVWDERATLCDKMLEFRAQSSFVADVRAGKLRKLHETVLNSVLEEYRLQVGNAAVRRQHGPRDLIEDKHKAREHHKLIMDRALLCCGYKNVERLGALSRAYGAVMDTFDAFLESGDSLSGTMLEAHETMATQYLAGVLQEAEEALSIYLHSENPGAKHPNYVLDKTQPAHLKLKRRHSNATDLMKLTEYPGVKELLSGGMTDTQHSPSAKGSIRTGESPTSQPLD